jgi:hypothetical protein
MDVQYPIINGNVFSFRSITLDIGGVRVRGFKEIKYSHGVEPGEVYGPDQEMQARTRGKYKCEGSLVVWQHEWDQLRTKLGDAYMSKVFTISVAYSERGSPLNVAIDTLVGVRVIKAEKGASEGDDANEVNLTLSIMRIYENYKSAT